ncbi:MAG: S8 family peptidase, partial [Burkholderiaceae bacterium]|nr:S8 family peptidase [Burkholderiaceae bacterium]
NAEAAWDVTPGSAAIVVAVIDTGVRPDHPDLVGKLLPGYDFVSEDGPGDFTTANDGNGRDSDPSDPGDWISAGENASGPLAGCGVSPSSWHGTQTAGLTGAATNNGVGMASVGRNVRVLPIRALGKCGGFLSDVVAAMRWAAGLSNDPVQNQNPARVINLSLGSSGACASSMYESAVAEILAAGVTIVAAAGNENGLAAGKPANCPGVIGVAGLRHSGTKVGYSNVGPELSIAAPAGNCVNLSGQCLFPLLTTTNTGLTTPAANTYSDGSDASLGTSFSSPLAAGAAGLMLSINSALTPAQIRRGLMGTARAFPTTGATSGTASCQPPSSTEQDECYCTTTTCGAGMMNTSGAVTAAAGLKAWATPASVQMASGSTTVISSAESWALPPNQIQTRTWSADPGGVPVTLTPSADGSTVTVTGTTDGTAVIRLTISDGAGPTAAATTTITISSSVSKGDGGGGGATSLTWLLGLLLAAAGLRRCDR